MDLENASSTRDAILKAVLKHITEKGTHVITIREIAKLANVNSAAISYYFGSKDGLIQEASKHYYRLSDRMFEELKDSQEAPKVKLLRFCQNYSELMLTYPGFLKAQIAQYILEEGTRPEVEEWIGRSLQVLKEVIREASGIEHDDTLLFKAMQLFSGLVYPFLLNKYGHAIGRFDFANKEVRESYILSLLSGVCGWRKNS